MLSNLKVGMFLFPLPPIVFLVGFALLMTRNEGNLQGLGVGLIIGAFVQCGAQVLLLKCSRCGKSPYIRKRGGYWQSYSTPLPEKVCSECGTLFNAPQ